MPGQGLFAAQKFGLQVTFKTQIGSMTGRQAFTTWQNNTFNQYRAQMRRTLFRAGGFARTTMRRRMRRSGRPIADPDRVGWYSYRPAPRGNAPRYRPGGGKANMRNIRFTRPTLSNLETIIGPEVLSTSGQRRVNFNPLLQQERGGSGMVYLPVPPAQNPFGVGGGRRWPFAWTPARYPARPIAAPAIRPTMAQFPDLFATSSSR